MIISTDPSKSGPSPLTHTKKIRCAWRYCFDLSSTGHKQPHTTDTRESIGTVESDFNQYYHFIVNKCIYKDKLN